jgi:hypothetical protein
VLILSPGQVLLLITVTTALTWSILSLSARRSKRIQNTIRKPLEYYRDGDFEGALTAADSIVDVGR